MRERFGVELRDEIVVSGDVLSMAELVIHGGRRLSGRIAVEGNKNAALPLLAACLLTTETCELRNVPRIRDVAVMIDLLRSLGAEVERAGIDRCA